MSTLATSRFVLFGPFRFDTANRLLLRDGAELPVPPRVLAVLECLLARPGTIVPKQEILDLVWKDAFVTDTSLAEAVSFLRQTLGDDPQAPAYIQTLHRRGYRFVAPVTRESDLPSDALPAAPRDAAEPARDAGPPASREANEAQPSIGALIPWGIALLLGATLVVALWKVTHPPDTRLPRVVRFEVVLPASLALRTDRQALALSPDGGAVAIAACDASGCRLLVRDFGSLSPRTLEGTEGAAAPFFSPDGRDIGFFAAGKLKKVALSGGAPVILCDAPDALGATWLDDGRIVFAGHTTGGLEVVSDVGGTAAPFTRVEARSGDVGHRWPQWIAGSEYLLFTATTGVETSAQSRALAVSLRSQATTVVTARAAAARFLSPELVIFARGSELYASRFEARGGVLATAPVQVAGNVALANDGAPLLAASTQGALVRLPSAGHSRVLQVARAGLQDPGEPLSAAWTAWAQLRLAPDATRAAGVTVDGIRSELWIADVARGATTRLTHEQPAAGPQWAADGRSVVVSLFSGSAYNLWRADANSGALERLSSSESHQFATSVAVSGAVVFTQIAGNGHGDVWLMQADGRTEPLVRSPFDERGGVLSPDERLLAYESDESGLRQVYVKPRQGATRHVVSPGGGTGAAWTRSDRLLYQNDSGAWEVTIGADGTPTAPRRLAPRGDAEVVDVRPDGFLLARDARGVTQALQVTLEAWQEIARAVPPAVTALPR